MNGKIHVMIISMERLLLDGEKYGTFYGFAFNGLDPTNGRPTFKNLDIDVTENDLDYLVKLGCLEPDISGGLNTSLRYKRLIFTG